MPECKIIHVVGNRPQFIKLAMLYPAIKKHTSLAQSVIHTGQHSSAVMSDIFFESLALPSPDFQLNIREITADGFIGQAATKIFEILTKSSERNLVVVYGDTNSTLAAAIAATRSNKRLLHFESGVRTMDRNMPEEINRVLTDRLSNTLYCCTELNKRHLIEEGFGDAIPAEVIVSGDLMLDAFLKIHPKKQTGISTQNYIACTIHRAGNITDKKHLQHIASAINKIHRQSQVVIPLHPHTSKRLHEFGIELNCTHIKPLGYPEMKQFISDADYVITDSGGVSREAFFANKKSLILMDSPFWPEIVTVNAALNCGPDEKEILNKFHQLPSLPADFGLNIFGDGNAAKKIAVHLNSLAV